MTIPIRTAVTRCSATRAAAYKTPVGGWNDPDGWTVTAVAKVVQNSFGKVLTSGDERAHVYGEILDGADRWDIHLIDGQWADVDPYYWTEGMYVIDSAGKLLKIADVDVHEYHKYQASYDPSGGGGGGAVTYYLDDVAVATRTRAEAQNDTLDWVAFGSPAKTYSTKSRWNEFTLATGQVPEPAALVMLISGLVGLAFCARRRK